MNVYNCIDLPSMIKKILREAEQIGNCSMVRKFDASESCICYKIAVTSAGGHLLSKKQICNGRRKVFFICK
jgi:hypothetical protein